MLHKNLNLLLVLNLFQILYFLAQNSSQVGSGDTSTTGSQIQEPRVSGIDSMNAESTTNSASVVSFAEAQRLISLFFALCTKVCLS